MPAKRQFVIDAPSIGNEADRDLFDDIRAYLTRQEAINTIRLAGFGPTHGFDPSSVVLVAHTGNGIDGVATLSGAFNLLLSHTDELDAVDALADAVIEREIAIPGVIGPSEGSRRFAERWVARTGGTMARGMAQRILETREVPPPADVSGTWRHVTPDDRPRLHSWFTAFVEEAEGLSPDEGRTRIESMVDGTGQGGGGGIVWENVKGNAVSVACFKSPTPHGIRIGPVYTPPEHRRRGYAGAATAVATGLLLDRGYDFVCLYTNADNATANHVYESIGFTFVADSMVWTLTDGTRA